MVDGSTILSVVDTMTTIATFTTAKPPPGGRRSFAFSR